MRTGRVALLCLIGALASLTALLAAGQEVPSFRTGIQQIEVQVSVTDANGRPVTDLTRDDFEVLEDNVRQTPTSFTVQVAGGREQTSAPTAGSAATAANDTEGDLPGHSYVLILDSAWFAEQARRPALEFIDRILRPGDEAAVLTAAWNKYLPPATLPMLGDREQLKAIVNGVVDEWQEASTRMNNPRANPANPTDIRNRVPHRALKLPSIMLLRDVAIRLSSMPGRRKAIVLFTAGTTLFWNDNPRMIETSLLYRRAFEDAMRMATLAGIPVHTVESSGLFPSDPSGNCVRVANLVQGSLGRRPIDYNAENQEAQDRLRQKQRLGDCDAQSSVRLFAEVTGGVAIVNTNRFTENYERIIDFRWPTYVLGYSSPLTRHDGRYHAITVKVARPGVKVSATRGFYAFKPGGSTAPAATPPRSLSAAAKAALEGDVVPSTLSVTAHAWAPASGSLLIGATVSDGGRPLDPREPLELAFAAFDSDGILRVVTREVVRVPNRRDGPASATVSAYARLVAGAGSRVMVIASQGNGLVGTGSTQTVARDGSAPLSAGDILLASSRPDDSTVVLKDDTAHKLLSAHPTQRRTFGRDEVLTMTADIVEPVQATPGLAMRARLTSQAGVVVWTRRAVTQPTQRGGLTFFKGTLPLAGIEPGDYSLSFETQWTGTDTTTASPDVLLTVR